MTGAVHVGIGTAIGAILKHPGLSFTAGIISHIVADALPHKDFSAESEVIFSATALAFVGARYGWKSPEMYGAIGALLPDTEHCIAIGGIISPEQKIFPSHTNRRLRHGAKTGTSFGTALIFAGSIIVAEIASAIKKHHCMQTTIQNPQP